VRKHKNNEPTPGGWMINSSKTQFQPRFGSTPSLIKPRFQPVCSLGPKERLGHLEADESKKKKEKVQQT